MIEVFKQMVQALENSVDLVIEDAYNAEQLYANVPTKQTRVGGLKLLADEHQKAIQAGRQAIANLESQEPFEDLATELFVVAQVSPADNGFSETIERIESWLREHFTRPPQRTWVGLTDEEQRNIAYSDINFFDWGELMDATEAKLKQKNGFAEENT